MSGSGLDLDSWTAGYQTRDLQRDAPYRLGAVVFAVALFLGMMFIHRGEVEGGRFFVEDVYLKWLAAAVLAVVAGLIAGRLAILRLAAVERRRVQAMQAERRARNQVALDAFLDNGNR
jgi:hypothetical protein